MHSAHHIKYIIFPLFINLFLILNIYAAGEVDPGFNASAQFKANGPIHKIVRLSDGKVLVGGSFTVINGIVANSLVRLNADGSIDTSFSASPSLKATTIYSIAIQPDGKILVGYGGNGAPQGIQRLNADGSQDTTLNNIVLQFPAIVFDIKVLPDGKFLAAGGLNYQNTYKNLIRFNSDGTRDNSFLFTIEGNVREVLLLPDGKILAGGRYSANINGFLLRLNSDGSTDSTFGNLTLNGAVEDFELQSDGKIIFSGAFQTVNGQPRGGIARVNGDGTFDGSFNASNTGANGSVNEFIIHSDGKIFIGGDFMLYNNVAKPKVARLNADGSLDPTFTTSLSSDTSVQSIVLLPNNKILAGYSGGLINPNLPNGMSALNSDGSTDSALTYNTSKFAIVRKTLEQPDGKIIIGGNFDIVNNVPRVDLARLNSDGSLDTSFVPVSDTGEVTAMALQSDGKILVGFNNTNTPSLKRFNADGSLDTSFDSYVPSPSLVNDIVVLPNGKILVAGLITSTLRAVVRLNANGTLDNTFNFPTHIGYNLAYKILVEPDGRFLVGRMNSIQRHTADGAFDGTFNTNLVGTVYDLARQPDGKIIAVGSFTTVNGNPKRNIVRLSAEGVLDTTFTASTDAYVVEVKIQSDRKIVIGGQFAYVNGIFRTGLARLNADGTVDETFTANANDVVSDFFFSNNKIIVAGAFTGVNEFQKITIARLNTIIPPRAPFDFDGDGRADIGVYRPSNNVWYQLLGQNYQFSSFSFGLAEDILAPADYDGDGKTDFGIFRPSTGVFWYAASTQGNAFRAVQWGQSGDVPRPADFDGDGKADFIVYRPSENRWLRLGSTGLISNVVFGAAGDKPLIGDFDGDGKSDPAVFRPSTGAWWYAASSQSGAHRAVQFGLSTDIPVPADFDGDGKTDFVVYRPSDGVWHILQSSNNNYIAYQFGLSEDKPIAADYDGDGKADMAVYRPSNGVWYLNRSTAGFTGIQLGASTDLPIPNAFIQ